MRRPASSGSFSGLLARCIAFPYWLIALSARVFPAAVFWQSGQTKVAGWHLKPGAIALFQNDYQLPLMIDPTVAAYVSAFNEHLFPILLVLGLATRFAALALLLMTAVIEIFVYPGAWPTQHSEAPGLGSLPDMECGPRVSYCCSRGGRAHCRSTI